MYFPAAVSAWEQHYHDLVVKKGVLTTASWCRMWCLSAECRETPQHYQNNKHTQKVLNLAPINSYDPPTQVLQTRADIGSRRPRDGDTQSANNDLKCLKRSLSKEAKWKTEVSSEKVSSRPQLGRSPRWQWRSPNIQSICCWNVLHYVNTLIAAERQNNPELRY